MPPFDFPSAPIVGEEYTGFGVTYRFTGKVWNLKPEASPEYVLKAGDTMTGPLVLSGDAVTALEAVPLQQVTAGFVAKPGDTMTGALRLPLALPIAPEEAAHKQYVDQSIAAASLYQGPWQVAANIPDLDPAVMLPLHTYSWIAQTVDKDLPEIAPPTLPGIGGQNVASGDTIVWNANTLVYDQIRAPASTAGYVPLVGGTMTGVLTIDGVTNPTMVLNNPQGANNRIEGRKDGVARWTLDLGGAAAENTSNAGSDFVIYRFVNDGSTYTKAMQINRSDGYMTLTGGIGFGSFAQDAANLKNLNRHLALYGTTFGFNVTGSTLNYHVSTGSKHDFHVDGVTQLRVQTGTSYVYSNLSCAGTITSTIAQGNTALQMSDGVKIDFSSGCQIRKVYGANQFQFHTNASQVFTFHISNTGDVFVIDTVGSTGNSVSVTAPEAVAVATDLGLTPDAERGVDVMKVMAAMVAKIKLLEADIAAVKGTPR